jgi:formylglycine-generating enzyme required for sulfatase activity
LIGEKHILEINNISVDLVKIPAGEFQMGSISELPYALETPVHSASISYEFFIGAFTITQEQFAAIMGTNPAHFRHAENLPIENVSWFDARTFCQKISEKTGRRIRLPSETEWEYVTRAGTTTEYFFGDDSAKLPDYAWFEINSSEQTAPIGLKKPNPWGIYDIVGNVWEWCEDAWKSDYNDFSPDGSAFTNEKQPRRAVRGGAWNMDAFRCRSSYRSFDWNDAANNRLGFRIVVEL